MTIPNQNSILVLLFLSALSVAGAAVLWRKILIDHPPLKRKIEKHLGRYGQALLCGSCFTYWLSLAFVLAFDPLAGWNISGNTGIPESIIHAIASWMALSMASIILRFGYVLIQELVHRQMHGTHEDGRAP